ncbi:MAG: type I-C CRISPR-associated protein Cas5c [Eubacteriales bacterium]|nr:type I-C CRISPR-associated protein Cas5c [Eubacteriales bacterium]
MENENKVTFLVYGRYALFSDPLTRIGGEKCSYMIPTYEALRGICESIYWKPTICWIIDRVQVMKPFQSQSKGVRPISMGSDPATLSIYNYLKDVAYQVEAHFEWNERRPELQADRNENKHYYMMKRSIEKGGRRDVFLGTRECQAYVEPCVFREGESPIKGEMSFGLQFHGFTYGDEGEGDELIARFWNPKMIDGIVRFCRPEECPVQRRVKPWAAKTFTLEENVTPVEKEWEESQS